MCGFLFHYIFLPSKFLAAIAYTPNTMISPSTRAGTPSGGQPSGNFFLVLFSSSLPDVIISTSTRVCGVLV